MNGAGIRGEAAPSITNQVAAQRPGTKLVDIVYDLAAPGFPTVAVTLEASSDGGATWTVPVSSASGAVGTDVEPGTGKSVVWNAGADWPEGYSKQMRVRVIVDDGSTCEPLPLNGTPPAAPAGFSLIPGGSFTMGVTSGDTDADAPPTTVTVSPFYIQQTETTKAQWDEVRNWGLSNGYTDLEAGAGKASNHPVQTVTWWEVVKWCNARSEKEGLSPCYYTGPQRRDDQIYRSGSVGNLTVCWGANGYRLPTEAEWEKAARGGLSDKRFPWGTDTISHAQANYYGSTNAYDLSPIDDSHPIYTAGELPYTSPVGSFGANGYGLYDMAGNAWEWCWDWYGNSYFTTSNGTTDPRGPASGTYRVIRGGSWNFDAINARCAGRDNYAPGSTVNGSGFRPVRSSVP